MDTPKLQHKNYRENKYFLHESDDWRKLGCAVKSEEANIRYGGKKDDCRREERLGKTIVPEENIGVGERGMRCLETARKGEKYKYSWPGLYRK